MSKIPDPTKMKRVKGPILTKRQFERAKVRITMRGLLSRIERLERAVFKAKAH